MMIVLLAAIAALGSLAIHMLVPALPLMAHDLAIGEAQAQLAISAYLAGLGGGQLLVGPLADRVGRRPVMLAGLAAFITGSAGAALAPSLPVLLAARLLQALGGAAGVVTARVMVGDIFGEKDAAAKQATLMAVVLISPALAPLIGGALADVGGWRTIPGILFGCGAIAAAAVIRWMPEARSAIGRVGNCGLLTGYGRLSRNRKFVLTTATLTASSCGLYMFLGASSFLLMHRFGLTAAETGVALLVVAVSGVIGTRLVMIAERHGSALKAGTLVAATGAAGCLVGAILGINSVAMFMAPLALLGIGAGLVGPAAFTAIAFAEQGLAATATSLAGATQMLASGLAVSLLGLFEPVDPLRLGIALAISAAVALICSLLH